MNLFEQVERDEERRDKKLEAVADPEERKKLETAFGVERAEALMKIK